MSEAPLLEVKNVDKHFPVRGGVFRKVVGQVYAVNGVSFQLHKEETLGLVGESGCGKSTLGRTLIRLYDPTRGEIKFEGRDVGGAQGRELFKIRRNMAMIFQDPYASLNPRMTVADIIAAPMRTHGVDKPKERKEKIAALLEVVGLRAKMVNRYPHEFSGGQRQRIGLARALILHPKLVIADEPVSALDVSIQAQVINLMMRLKERFKLTYIFIAHDLAVVRHISTSVAVMYLGHIVEKTSSKQLYDAPKHPYTQALIASIPIADPRKRSKKKSLVGDVPSPMSPPTGCVFHTRCPVAEERCRLEAPALRDLGTEKEEHLVSCHLAS